MAMTREEEERQRVAKAHQNIADWQAKYAGFSGGVRVVYQNGREVNELAHEHVGDPVLARKIEQRPPSIFRVSAATYSGGDQWVHIAKPAVTVAPVKPRWWQRLLSIFR